MPEIADVRLLHNRVEVPEGGPILEVAQFASMLALTRLECSNCRASAEAPSNFQLLFPWKPPALQWLSLRDTPFSKSAAQEHCKGREALRQLQHLDLVHSPGVRGHPGDILQALPAATRLPYLRLRLDVSADAAEVVLQACGQLTSLQSLTLSLDALDWRVMVREATWESLSLQRLRQLRQLVIVGSRLGSVGAQALAVALPRLTKLTSLCLSGSWRERAPQHAAASRTPRTARLQCVVELLAQALQAMPQFAELRLYENGLGDDGLRALVPALASSTRLTSLALPWNEIGNAAAPLVARTARGLPLLQAIDVASVSGEFSGKVASLLREYLLCLPHVHDVSL
jgi:hypothetical protein